MTTMQVESLSFQFPDTWAVTRYDDWSFYKNRFKDACGGNKAIDLLALDPVDRTLWLIEVKDYRRHPREKVIELWDEIALKSRDTLAGLVAARFNGEDAERKQALRSLQARRLRIVFHLEQPEKHSKLFPRSFDPANIQQKLRQIVRPIDPHALVVEKNQMGQVLWVVT
ncbi:MAG: hypothetical protein DWI57_12275 [Chloroflexi bacterium]|nr:MAG: hypothetical protein DWI57_12275 [Chloroflexota bacterium]